MNFVKLAAVLLLTCITSTSNAQQTDLATITGFDKVQINNVNGDIDITITNDYSIKLLGDSNARSQISFRKHAGTLEINVSSAYTANWKNNGPLKIQITMPALSNLRNTSNGDISIKDFEGKQLSLENKGNGNIHLQGKTVAHLSLTNEGNGDQDAKNIIAQTVVVNKVGNGDVRVRTPNNFDVRMNGNGDVVNYGTGKAIIQAQAGTGKVVYVK